MAAENDRAIRRFGEIALEQGFSTCGSQIPWGRKTLSEGSPETTREQIFTL